MPTRKAGMNGQMNGGSSSPEVNHIVDPREKFVNFFREEANGG